MVTLELIVRELSKNLQNYYVVDTNVPLLKQFLGLTFHSEEKNSSTQAFFAILYAYCDVYHSSHDLGYDNDYGNYAYSTNMDTLLASSEVTA